ncbi:MAG: efflux RND transporter periplasmic adaptor subunit [Proteobacteria bacterium]|nr:efflux RND transporter periplasmic adaptor subunit [Pseudomonadota bacterium]
MKLRLSCVLPLALAVFCCGGLRSETSHGDKGEPSVLVEISPARQHVIERRLVVYGHLQVDPINQSSIVISHDGTVDRVDVRAGQRVSKGTAIATLVTAPAARMQFEQAKAQLEFARQDLARLQGLMVQKLATTDQVAGAENTLKQAESAFATQQQLRTGQENETIIAPFDGIVVKLLANPGDRLVSGNAVAVLANEKSLLVTLGLEPEEASAVKSGQPVAIRSPFLSSLLLRGTIDRVHALTDPSTRLVDAIVRLSETESHGLTLGMAIEGSILLRESKSIALPRSAVLRDDGGDYIFVVKDSIAHRIAVTVGDEQQGLVAVAGGVKESDSVVVTGNYELHDGMKVRIKQ